MFGAFCSGFLGGVLQFGGVIAVLLSLIGFVFGGPAAGAWFVFGIGLFVAGAYLKFRSAHSVQIVNLPPAAGPREPLRPRRMSDSLLNPPA